MREPLILFAGPSLHGLNADLYDHLTLLPPVKRGDVENILRDQPKAGRMIIADGEFYQYPAVGHAEIRDAIAAGWEVMGVSSMGAIRAAEMADHGMLGYGKVYQRFRSDPEFRDDEVALLYMGEPPYLPVTEPLIHIRVFLTHLLNRNLIDHEMRTAILSSLENMWFGHRDIMLVRRLLINCALLPDDLVVTELSAFERFRIKNHDLHRLLAKLNKEGPNFEFVR